MSIYEMRSTIHIGAVRQCTRVRSILICIVHVPHLTFVRNIHQYAYMLTTDFWMVAETRPKQFSHPFRDSSNPMQ
jgi:hypothetical protein